MKKIVSVGQTLNTELAKHVSLETITKIATEWNMNNNIYMCGGNGNVYVQILISINILHLRTKRQAIYVLIALCGLANER